MGVQPGGSDFTPGSLKLKVTNTTGNTIVNVYVSYKVCSYNDQARSNSMNFSWATADNPGDRPGANYTSVATLNYASGEAAAGAPSWLCETKSTTINGVNLANNADFCVRMDW